MTNCPQCEYHKNRAAMWRAEAYAQAGHDIIERTWVGLTDVEVREIIDTYTTDDHGYDIWCDTIGVACAIEAKLKEKNT